MATNLSDPRIPHCGMAAPKELAHVLEPHQTLLFASEMDNVPLTLGEANQVSTHMKFKSGTSKQISEQSRKLPEGASFMKLKYYAAEILGIHNA